MVTALSDLEPHCWCQLRIASVRRNFGVVGSMCQRHGSCVYRAGQWLFISFHTTQWTVEACLAAAGLMCCGFRCRLAAYGAPTVVGAQGVHRAMPQVCVQWSQESKSGLQPIPMTQYFLLDRYCKG